MGPQRSAVHQAVADIRAKATELRASFGAEGPARALEWAATKLETALISEADRIVYLSEAARISGYCEGHLARAGTERRARDLPVEKESQAPAALGSKIKLPQATSLVI